MKLTTISRVLLIAAAALLCSSIFTAIWRIELAAPQYPEGLALLIYADKLGGDVDIINGLNHYIGMQTLHTENFMEFTLLPYLIGAYALFTLIVAIAGNKKLLNILLTAFILFGVVAMADFYRWNYNYGHNLDPHAAIVVPGMAYQPPLIGYKQLLNFGAYSVPDIGGWLFVSAGALMLLAVVLEYRKVKNNRKAVKSAAILSLLLLFSSCGSAVPKPVKLNKDNCDFCKMTVSDEKFVGQVITKKGRYYFFDDLACMVKFIKQNKTALDGDHYSADFKSPSRFIPLGQALLMKSDKITSPMGGNMVAFSSREDADEFRKAYGANSVVWKELIK